METRTQPKMQPPGGGGVVTATGFPEDEIPELAARIAALTPGEAKQLKKYLLKKQVTHGVGPPSEHSSDGNTTITPNAKKTP